MEGAVTSPDESHGWRDERLSFGTGCVCGSLACGVTETSTYAESIIYLALGL